MSRWWEGGTPSQVQTGVPHPRSGGVPHPRSGGGTPSQVWTKWVPHPADGGTPSKIRMGGILGYPPFKIGWGTSPPSRLVPPTIQDWMEYPPARTGWGTPLSKTECRTPPPPSKTGWGTPPSPRLPPSGDRLAKQALATQRAVCLLRSRRRTFLLCLISQ